MSESCGECGAETEREPLCEQCNDAANSGFDSMVAEVKRLRALNADLLRRLTSAEVDACEFARRIDKLEAEKLDLQQAINQQAENCTAITARLEAENAELRDAGGDLHFQLPIWGPSNAVAASQRWKRLVGPEKLNGGELQRLTKQVEALKAENAELRASTGFRRLERMREELAGHRAGTIADLDKLKARLAWFEETWPFVQAIVDADYDDIEHQDALLDRLRASPKPSEGT